MYTDTVMQCQGQRGVIEISFANEGLFMFHAHQSEFTEPRLDGLLQRRRLMEACAERLGRASAGAWALGSIVILALVVGAFAATGSSLVELIGRNPPRPTSSTGRRVEFRPGEIRARDEPAARATSPSRR